MMMMTNPEIVNMTVTMSFEKILELSDIRDLMEGVYNKLLLKEYRLSSCTYNRQFSGARIKYLDTGVTTLLFKSGKVVAVGSRTEAEALYALEKLESILCTIGINVSRGPLTIHNAVAAGGMGKEIDLNKLCKDYPMRCHYNPELFCGLKFSIRAIAKKPVAIIFSSGKFNVTGTKSPRDAKQLYYEMQDTLSEYLIA
jgi:transcription initiation factor TFIID TATA-box-binding protein